MLNTYSEKDYKIERKKNVKVLKPFISILRMCDFVANNHGNQNCVEKKENCFCNTRFKTLQQTDTCLRGIVDVKESLGSGERDKSGSLLLARVKRNTCEMDHGEKYGNPCYANVRARQQAPSVGPSSLDSREIFPTSVLSPRSPPSCLLRFSPLKQQNRTRLRSFLKKCTIGVVINTLAASSYCPSAVVTFQCMPYPFLHNQGQTSHIHTCTRKMKKMFSPNK
ncbi:hypothetical protein DBV15_05114, partial [Temnothorax longispinosus]